jgi:hypothetical protein
MYAVIAAVAAAAAAWRNNNTGTAKDTLHITDAKKQILLCHYGNCQSSSRSFSMTLLQLPYHLRRRRHWGRS